MIDKISENLEVIFARDRERIAKKDEQIKAHVKGMKEFKRDRKKLVEELDLLLPFREQDLLDFKEKRQEYYEKAGLAIDENAKLDQDIIKGKLTFDEHKKLRRKPESIRDEWRKKFWAEYELTLTPIRERHAKILEIGAKISFIDTRLVSKQQTIYGLEVLMAERKLEDLKRYAPGNLRSISISDFASEKALHDQLAKGKCAAHYIADITSNKDLLDLPLDARFQFDHLDLVYALIEKFRDVEFATNDKLHLTYQPITIMGKPPNIQGHMIWGEQSKAKRKDKNIVMIAEKDPSLEKKADTSIHPY